MTYFRFFAERCVLLALFALLDGECAAERCADFFVAELDLDLDVFDCFADFFVADLPEALVCDLAFDGEASTGVLTLAGLALRTIGGAAAASSKGKGASSANTNPEHSKEPINNIIFRSTLLPLFQNG